MAAVLYAPRDRAATDAALQRAGQVARGDEERERVADAKRTLTLP
jgi:hypothetical protein